MERPRMCAITQRQNKTWRPCYDHTNWHSTRSEYKRCTHRKWCHVLLVSEQECAAHYWQWPKLGIVDVTYYRRWRKCRYDTLMYKYVFFSQTTAENVQTFKKVSNIFQLGWVRETMKTNDEALVLLAVTVVAILSLSGFFVSQLLASSLIYRM